jgi:hypothetical protein
VKIKKNVFDRNPPPADAFSEPPPVKQETTCRGRETGRIIIQQFPSVQQKKIIYVMKQPRNQSTTG